VKLSDYRQYSIFLNSYQGDYKRVVCVCTAGILRSPTAALVLSRNPYNYNTRCAGVDPNCALVHVSRELLFWANEIVCMEVWHANQIFHKLTEYEFIRKVTVLDIEDKYAYRDSKLMRLIKEKYDEKTLGNPMGGPLPQG
jgi:predicted protein tyrosine phosphatase